MERCNIFQYCVLEEPVRNPSEQTKTTRTISIDLNAKINEIEAKYNLYVNGTLKCTPKEGAIIINNYNSRKKIYTLF